jgi:hypothetical protein
MSEPAQPGAAIPPDDPNRKLSVAEPEDPALRHVAVVGGTYTILLSGANTAGRYCLIDMLVPPAAGPARTGTISRKCSRCLKARSRSPFAARHP